MVPNLMIFQLYDGAKRFALGRNRTLNFDLFPLAVRSAVLSCDAGPSSECSSQAARDRSGDDPGPRRLLCFSPQCSVPPVTCDGQRFTLRHPLCWTSLPNRRLS